MRMLRPPVAVPVDAGPDAQLDLVARIRATPLQMAPFDHIYMEQVFPRAYYRRLLDLLPEAREYREFRHRDAMQADGHSTRRKLTLFPERIMRLPSPQRAVWRDLSRVLRSPELQEAFKTKFRVALERRFQRPIGELSFYPVPMLLRDLPGYQISIHGDSLSKAITVQFYLPRDESQSALGTIFHEGRSGEAALRTRRLAFRPASGYAFPVVYHESWHSVDRTSDVGGQRDSLMLTYYVQDGAWRWLFLRLKRLWLFLVFDLHS
jgi:hypothetical protein